MTLQDAIRLARRRLDDFGGDVADDQWLTDDTDLLWSNVELVEHFDEAQREYCRRRPIRDDLTPSVCQIQLKTSTSRYKLDPRIISIEAIWNGDHEPLAKIFVDEYRQNPENYSTASTVNGWFCDQDQQWLTVVGTPLANQTVYLDVERYPLETLDWDLRECDLEVDYPQALIDWVLHLCYLKNDSETYDERRSNAAAGRFTARVGPPRAEDLREVDRQVGGRRMRTTAYFW